MSVVTATFLSDGAKVSAIYQLISIDVRREVNRIPHASLVLLDGDSAERKFPISDAKYFEPGREIEVKLRYEAESEDATLFKGPVIRHAIEASARGSLLRVDMQDAAIKLTQARQSTVFADKTDSELIGKLVKDGGLKPGTVDSTQVKHKQMVQYNATSWDFILTRAEANSLLVLSHDGEVSARKAAVNGQATHKFKYGIDEIYDLELEADARDQYAEVKGSAWDPKQQKPTEPAQAKVFALSQGNLDGKKLAGAVGFGAYSLSHPVPLAAEELQAWADARMMRSRLAMLRGRLSTRGFAQIKLLDVMELDGVGQRFSGKAIVTGICHRVDVAGWRTDIQFGLAARGFAREEGVSDAPAAGLLPAVAGLHIGVVDKFEEDPDKEFRVKLILPGIDPAKGTVWARLAAPDAGKNRGWFFRPEAGDEVVVGFFNDDPRQAVVLGGLYSSKNTPPEKYSEITKDNKTKAIVTKTGTVFAFTDDKKGSVLIETAEGARVLVDDSAKSIELKDQNGNEIRMDKDGITLKSGKDLKLEASGNVEIKGAKVDIK